MISLLLNLHFNLQNKHTQELQSLSSNLHVNTPFNLSYFLNALHMQMQQSIVDIVGIVV
jgi:hypothetical protein